MGQQAYFSRAAAAAHSFKMQAERQVHSECCVYLDAPDEICPLCGELPTVTEYINRGIAVPGGDRWAVDYGDAKEVCIDFNSWGTIRGEFKPVLESLGIEYEIY